MRLIFLFLLTLVVLGLAPAEADSRDDVMSNVFRCNSIESSRVWLECYNGASQPLRAALGLSPAPVSQTQLVQSPPVSGKPADGKLRIDIIAAALRCYDFSDNQQWLDCYYGASQALRATIGLPAIAGASAPPPRPPPMEAATTASSAKPLDVATVTPRAPPVSTPADRFGKPAAPAPKNDDRVISKLTSYTFDAQGIFKVALANGQEWQQISGDTDNATNWKGPASAYVAIVTHGFMGSYNFQLQGVPGRYKVQRIK